MKLYEYPKQFDALVLEIVDDHDNVITDEMRERWNALEVEFRDKVEATAKVVKNVTAQRDALDAEGKRLRARAKTLDGKIKWLKSYIQECMTDAETDRIEGDVLTITIQNNAPSLRVLDESAIPDEFFVVPDRVLQKSEVMRVLKSGQEMAGAEMATTRSIRIR